MPSLDDPGESRRKSQRRRSFKGATVIFNNRNSVVTGLVRDFSEAGAKFIVGAPVDLPSRVQLKFASGEEYDAEVVWHQGKTQFGLRFIAS